MAVVVASTVTGIIVSTATASPAAAVAGVPANPQTLFLEDFENRVGATGIQRVTD